MRVLSGMSFAFLVHPRADVRQDMARISRPLGLIPNRVYDKALRRLPLPPLSLADVSLDGHRAGRLIVVPFGARHLLTDRKSGARKVTAAVDEAVAGGAGIVGLGGLTSPVTNGGRLLGRRTDIGVTNGNAFTAAIVHRQLTGLLESAPWGRVAVIGATGSVGSAVTRLLARDRRAEDLLLLARDGRRLSTLAAGLGAGVTVRTATELAAARECDIVVLLTSAADTLIGPEHLGPGAIVLDATQPRNTRPELLRQRPDVRVLDGGVVDLPGLRLHGGSMGLPAGRAYACLAETMLLSLAGHDGHFCLGRPTLDQVDRMQALADRFASSGFRPAPATSFGAPVESDPHSAAGIAA